MRIICPTCASHYEVELEKIAAQGQLVRCARCRDVWLVRSPEAQAAPAPAPEPRIVASAPAVEPVPAAVIDFQAAKVRLRRRERPSPAGQGRATSLNGLAVGAALLSSLACLYGFRTTVVRHMPAARAAYAALGLPVGGESLALRDVRSVLVADGGETVLQLQGKIANLRDKPTSVPGLTVVVRSEGKAPLYTWTAAAPQPTLARGESVDFKTRLVSPPGGARDVRVSFADAGTATTALLAP